MYSLSSKGKGKGRRNRIPRTRDVEFDKEYAPLSQQDCVKNIESLLVAFQAVFRGSVKVSIVFNNNTNPHYKGIYLASIHIDAINPAIAPTAIAAAWSQYYEVTTTGDIIVFGGQREAAWNWRFTYYQKCWRALAGWLKNIAESKLAINRTQSRLALYKEELMEVIWSHA